MNLMILTTFMLTVNKATIITALGVGLWAFMQNINTFVIFVKIVYEMISYFRKNNNENEDE